MTKCGKNREMSGYAAKTTGYAAKYNIFKKRRELFLLLWKGMQMQKDSAGIKRGCCFAAAP